MVHASTYRITELLLAWSAGDSTALEKLTPIVYEVLHRLAKHYMALENQGHILQTTALAHEAYIRLIDSSKVQWRDRAHFFAVAARMMRRILVDFARHDHRGGGGIQKVSLDEALIICHERSANLVALDEALDALRRLNARHCEVVELRFFGGLTTKEIAELINVSPATVRRDWRMARAWLRKKLEERNVG